MRSSAVSCAPPATSRGSWAWRIGASGWCSTAGRTPATASTTSTCTWSAAASSAGRRDSPLKPLRPGLHQERRDLAEDVLRLLDVRFREVRSRVRGALALAADLGHPDRVAVVQDRHRDHLLYGDRPIPQLHAL